MNELDDSQRQSTSTQMRSMVEWAFGPAGRDIPRAARLKAALVLADNIAAIVAAQDEPEVSRVQAQLAGGGSGAGVG